MFPFEVLNLNFVVIQYRFHCDLYKVGDMVGFLKIDCFWVVGIAEIFAKRITTKV